MKPFTLALITLPLFSAAYKGDMTHYTPGLGSCGQYTDPSKHAPIVALSREIMKNGPNTNNNPKCGTKINIYNPSTKKTHQATIVDTCWGCKKQDIDVNEDLFYQVAPKGDGRVHGIEWSGKAVGKSVVAEEEEEAWVEGGEADWQQEEEASVGQQRLGGSLRFRGEGSFVRGCGKMMGRIWETSRRFWEY
ncbi:MAG: hypothetical protein LQ343_007131 [Gyalolechia ehrenbergii]|nr:MAG: hypothetical protein LQ343_007131 [Gyalolechia ehrenbergii]